MIKDLKNGNGLRIRNRIKDSQITIDAFKNKINKKNDKILKENKIINLIMQSKDC